MPPPPPAPAPPPAAAMPQRRGSAPPPSTSMVATEPASKPQIETGFKERAQRIVIYGAKGIGKSSLAALAPSPLFLDCEDGTDGLDTARVRIPNWTTLRATVNDREIWKPFRTVVIDTGTAAQEFAVAHTIATVKHEKGHTIEKLADYGYGKGFEYVADVFLTLLGDLDRHIREGRNVIVIAHDTTEKVPNPDGEDFLQYQPAFQQPPKAGRIRDRISQWCDHMLFIMYDRAVSDGKAVGKGTRTIYPQERPTYWAKSARTTRALRTPIDFPEGSDEAWVQLGLN